MASGSQTMTTSSMNIVFTSTPSSTVTSDSAVLSTPCTTSQTYTLESGSLSVTTVFMVNSSTQHNAICTSATNIICSGMQTSIATSCPSITSNVCSTVTASSGTHLALIASGQTVALSVPSRHQTSLGTSTNVTAATQTATTSRINISLEERNFLRFVSLTLKVGPSAIRRFFDMLNDPDNLNKTISENEQKLKELSNQRIINKDHLSVLFPGNKHASSKRFDLTLMIAFLREITGIRTPKSGWNKLPDTNDRSTESDIARIKYYRNQVAHAASCTINTHDFQKRWEDLSEAIIRIGGEGFKSETSALLSAALDSSYQDLYLELRAMKKDIIPSNIQFVMDVKIQSMATEDKTFVSTRATKYVTDAVDQYGVVMVTGPPGSGKTATVNHIALQLQEKGYRICPVVSTNEIVEYWMPEVPQVFVFNDHFGVHDINQSELQQWMNNQERLNICFQYSNMKILATVRSHIIKDQQFSENVLSSTDLQIKSLVNDDIVLTDDERLQIFNAHVNINKRDDLKVMGVEIQNFTISCFPLLCKLYTSDRESKFSDKDFFKKPLSVISKDLDKFKINDPVHYFCLLYCMINDNNLVTDILSINEESKKVKKARKILLEKCKLSTTLSREEIRSKMDTLLNTYLKLEGNCYQFIHDIIHDAVIQHVNNLPIDWKPIILQYCGSKFLNERICLSYISCSHEGAHLSVNSDLESTWGRRILNDMVDYHSSWNYMVNNHSLYNEKSDTLLVQSFQCIDQTQLENIIKRSHPCRDLSPYFDAFSKIGKFYDPTSFVTDVTLLHLLICLGLKNCVKSILEKKKQILHQMNLLLVASIMDKRDIAEMLLLNGWNANICYEGEASILLLSSLFGHKAISELLLKHKANIEKCDKYGQSPLIISSENGHVEIVKLLLEHKADKDNCDRYGRSPLFISSRNGHVEIVKLLLEHKADKDQCDMFGMSPLIISSKKGHVDVVKLLLEHKADKDN